MARAAMPERFVLVCINERPSGHPRGSCIQRGSGEVFNAFREITGQRGLVDVKVTFTGCLEPCMVGPTVLVLPDYVWYGGVTVDDVPLIVDQHLIGDHPVEWLRIGSAEFALSPLEGRSDLAPGPAPPPGPTGPARDDSTR
ncbi:MAG: (2Fe-2S) ferredoxin domain-containing protein [Actinomycetota bacterium]|nr:(2Fe-2S) ferredoxin domain-containing protein [Actinomycetota bacterium]